MYQINMEEFLGDRIFGEMGQTVKDMVGSE